MSNTTVTTLPTCASIIAVTLYALIYILASAIGIAVITSIAIVRTVPSVIETVLNIVDPVDMTSYDAWRNMIREAI